MRLVDLVILVVVFIAAFLIVTSFVISHISGWRRLAGRNPGRPPTDLARRSFGSMAMRYRLMGYNNCVRFAADEKRLHISLFPPFCWLFHPPISIPWERIKLPASTERFRLFTRIVADDVAIWLPAAVVANEIALHSGAMESQSAIKSPDSSPADTACLP